MSDSRPAASQSRRDFLALMASGSAALLGCHVQGLADVPGGGNARLLSRPGIPSLSIGAGTTLLNPDNSSDGALFVPSGYDPAHPAPLVVALHGAGGQPQGPINLFGASAQSRGFLLLSPGSRGLTWDALTSRFSYDVTFIDGALKWTFDHCAIDPAQVILQGFSDGATYALGLGLANGDLFSRVVANSAGFIATSSSPPAGKPGFFVSHGRQDPILPIDNASRLFVPRLRNSGYEVDYTEFDGGHEVTADILALTVNWFLG